MMKQKQRTRWISLAVACVMLLIMLPFTAAGESTGDRYYVVDAINVAFRSGAGTGYSAIAHLNTGTFVRYVGATTDKSGNTWYQVSCVVELYQMGMVLRTGYIRADLLRTPSDAELAAYLSGSSVVPPTTDSGSNTNTNTNTGAPLGYVVVNVTNANIRTSASTSSSSRGLAPNGALLTIIGGQQGNDGYYWYQIRYATITGYVRGDLVRAATSAEIQKGTGATPTPTPSPTPTPRYTGDGSGGTVNLDSMVFTDGSSGRLFVAVNVDALNMRANASTSATIVSVFYRGAVMELVNKDISSNYLLTSGGVWWHVKTTSYTGYVAADLVRKPTASEVNAYLGGGGTVTTPSPAPTSNLPSGLLSGVVAIKGSATNIRTGAGISFGLVCKLNRDEFVTIVGYGYDTGNVLWYRISFQGKTGYVRYDLVRTLTAKESASLGLPSSPTPAPTVPSVTAPPTSSAYRNLKLGMSGSDVMAVQTALKKLGYLKIATVTNYYGTLTRSAVVAFQKAYGLTADGIAGPRTQEKLFSVAGGSSTQTPAPPITSTGGVVLADWYTVVLPAIKAHPTIVVTSVATGKSFNARYYNGEKHADIEPLTATDTSIMMSENGTAMGEYRRPVWVTINGVRHAGSLYAVPHGSDEAIKDNNMTGVVCIHFLNSLGHTTGATEPNAEHQASIYAAYDAGK